MSDPLLLHSMSEHRELIFACLEAAAPDSIVEIGSETGGFTKELAGWVIGRGGRFATVEPLPTDEIRALAEESERFELVRGASPEALERLEPAGAYVVDGDHNHWTVLRELRAIFGADGGGDRHPLAILHDVAWPCARRDQYYAPDRLPSDAVLPHTYSGGRVPGEPSAVPGRGFRGDGDFAVALEEGGARNGVLTAVEDFMDERPGLELLRVPAVFGVGYLFPADAPYAERVREVLRPWHESTLVRRLEENRVRLYQQVLDMQDDRRRVDARASRLVARHDQRIAELEAENASLRLERARLRERLAAGDGAPTPG